MITACTRFARRLRSDTRGAAAIEYALLAVAIGLGIVAALVSMKGSLNGTYTRIANGAGAASLSVPRCAIGSCADMSKPLAINTTNPNASSLLTSGWSGIEYNATWTTGTTSVMTLDLGNLINSGASTAQLDINAAALRNSFNCGNPTPCVPVTMAISVNGVDVGAMTYAVGTMTPTQQSVTLNQAAMAAIAANDGKAVITYTVDNHGVPSNLQAGYNDTRDLGVFFNKIAVH